MPLFDMLDNRSDSSDSGIDCLPTSPTLSDANSEHQYTFERGSLVSKMFGFTIIWCQSFAFVFGT